ncbi:MAG: hypothetical protein V4812_19300 [Pseudomonadota bacterium]
MRRTLLLSAVLWSTCGWSAEYPISSDQQRAQQIDQNTAACVEGIEALPDLRALYSRPTVQAYCTCRQRFSADVLADAAKNDRRGKAVQDEVAAYAEEKCTYILMQQLEHE